jgi:hypothetical protein
MTKPNNSINLKDYSVDNVVKMEALRLALQILDVPKTISMQFSQRSIYFRSLVSCKAVKVDIYFNVYHDYLTAKGVKSNIYNYEVMNLAVSKTLELMNTWINKERIKSQLTTIL